MKSGYRHGLTQTLFFSSNPQAKPNKNISLILWGHTHRCPLAHQHMTELLGQLHAARIPMVYCDEEYYELTIDKKVDSYRTLVSFLKQLPLDSVLRKEKTLAHEHFVLADAKVISELLQKLFLLEDQSGNQLTSMTNQVLRYAGLLELAKLSEQIKKLNIPYVGIDCDYEQHKKIYRDLHDNDAYMKAEQIRTDAMTNAIIDSALSQLPHGGILLAMIGNNHVHRLGANLWRQLQLTPDSSIKIFPLKLFSPYVEDGIASHKIVEVETRKMDLINKQQIYDSIVCQEILCEERQGKKLFVPDSLSRVINSVIKHVDQNAQEQLSTARTNFDIR
ncbi:MAG: hypothetical protein WCR08_02655 [Gammaproteobacteria bacterium]